VQVQSANASLDCNDITLSGLLLRLVCTTHDHDQLDAKSWIISVDQDLSLTALPPGFHRSEDDLLVEEVVPFKRTVLNIIKSDTTIATSSYEFNSADNGPTRRPTLTPSHEPTSQPSSAPSAQPSSSPTAAPTVSARPTSQPSTAGPTNTHKPTVNPTPKPSIRPSLSPSARPTQPPTHKPSGVPTMPPSTQATVKPSPVPSARPTRLPSLKPTSMPSKYPTAVPTIVPTVPASSLEDGQTEDSDNGRLPRYVVGACVGGGLLLLLVSYALYKYHEHNEEEKQKDLRRIDYYVKQAALCDKADAEWAEYVRRDAELTAERKANKARKEDRRAARAAQERSPPCGGAYAFGPVRSPPLLPAPMRPDSVSSADSVVVSSLHTSELSHAGEYLEEDPHTQSQSESWESVMEEGSRSATHSSEYSDFVNEIMDEASEASVFDDRLVLVDSESSKGGIPL
jgi:hypothetical protein